MNEKRQLVTSGIHGLIYSLALCLSGLSAWKFDHAFIFDFCCLNDKPCAILANIFGGEIDPSLTLYKFVRQNVDGLFHDVNTRAPDQRKLNKFEHCRFFDEPCKILGKVFGGDVKLSTH